MNNEYSIEHHVGEEQTIAILRDMLQKTRAENEDLHEMCKRAFGFIEQLGLKELFCEAQETGSVSIEEIKSTVNELECTNCCNGCDCK